MLSAFYYANSVQYGRHFREVKGFVNAYLDWEPNTPLSRKLPIGKRLYICLNIGWAGRTAAHAIAEAIKYLRPVWRRIVCLELADEPNWKPAIANANAAKVRAEIAKAGLEPKPLVVTFTGKQILQGLNWKATGIDALGIEAYIDYNPADGVITAPSKMRAHIRAQLDRIGNRKVVLIGQAYDRNGTWKNIDTLVAIQRPIFDAAHELQAKDRLLMLTLFSYARPGGTRDYPALKAEIKRQLSA